MPKNPRGYPDEIELKVDDRVGSWSDDDSFNTETQRQVAHDLLEEWPIEFQELADGKDYSRQMVPNVLEAYLGPVGDDITFGEIEDNYPSYEDYEQMRQEGLGQVDLPDDVELSKRELDLFVKGVQDGFEDGFQRGYERGLEHGRAQNED